VTSKSPVGDISVVTLIRTDTTLDHSQKAEKVWYHNVRLQTDFFHGARVGVSTRVEFRASAPCANQLDSWQWHSILGAIAIYAIVAV
jgi:hypothetical protein